MKAGPRNPVEMHEEVGARARGEAGRIRRMTITRTNSALYQVTGHRLLDDDVETRDAEIFHGVGFAARPSEDADTEAIVAFVGGPGNPIIIATRQEAVRRVIAADLEADETQLHNSAVLIRIKNDGTVEIRTSGGVAQELATKADVAALRATFNTHTHQYAPGPDPPVPTAPPAIAAAAPVGTSVLKAE